MLGPGDIGGDVALGASERSGCHVLELDAQGDLGSGELVGQHRHCLAEHVWPGLAGRDLVQSGPGAGGVDVGDERIDHAGAVYCAVHVLQVERGSTAKTSTRRPCPPRSRTHHPPTPAHCSEVERQVKVGVGNAPPSTAQ
jgi:hypothetical protein